MLATGLPSELLARRPDLRRAERQLAVASADISVATAELYPKFDLTLGPSLQSGSASQFLQLASGYWTIVPGVSWLLFDGGATRANIDKARAVYDETLAAHRAAYYTALEDQGLYRAGAMAQNLKNSQGRRQRSWRMLALRVFSTTRLRYVSRSEWPNPQER